MVRTIQEIFKVPARTRYLAAARSMTSVFTKDGDTSPYQAIVPAGSGGGPPSRPPAASWAARRPADELREIDDVPKDIPASSLVGRQELRPAVPGRSET
jgi:hypothetical protein